MNYCIVSSTVSTFVGKTLNGARIKEAAKVMEISEYDRYYADI